MHFTDAEFQAYARGDLDYNDARILEEAMAVEPRIARRAVAALVERRLGMTPPIAAGEAGGAETPPATVIGDSFRTPSPIQSRFLPATVAVLAVLLAGSGYLAGHSPSAAGGGLEIGTIAAPGLAASLASLPTGAVSETGGGEFRALSSFKSADGTLCREFSFTDTAGDSHAIACRKSAGWAVSFALFEPRGKNDEYVPADGNDLVSAYLQRVGAGAPLSGRTELEALHSIL